MERTRSGGYAAPMKLGPRQSRNPTGSSTISAPSRKLARRSELGETMSTSVAGDRIIDPMMAIANCSTRQRIVVVGAKSMELMMELHRRGYLLAAAAGNCGLPAGQYEVALVDWRRRTLHALDATLDWLDDFLAPRAELVIWLDAQKTAAKEALRAAVMKRGFVVLQGTDHPCGSVVLARRSQAVPVQQAA
ncbi:hypothetical protein JQ581_20145 [Bradyrhizobium liaoningense]|uniref:hypothetical protein n=1 Tax=Bradyrhizobium liaoningense TaxID=43992 RepID=UPI001BA579CF|nr:hypothetical protein [Bradyrhizobium liaoningense]MBR0739248.1 hypothetical protein [Bradyrhizobium liaoningense]